MDIKKVTDYAGWAQAGVAGLIAAVGPVFWAGQVNTQIKEQHQAVMQLRSEQSSDHDKVITLESEVHQIQQDTAETKNDVKQVLQNQADVKAALDHFQRKADHATH